MTFRKFPNRKNKDNSSTHLTGLLFKWDDTCKKTVIVPAYKQYVLSVIVKVDNASMIEAALEWKNIYQLSLYLRSFKETHSELHATLVLF